MENLIIEKSPYTPEISLDKNGIINLKGRSYPENTFEFYEPMMNWVEEYFSNLPAEITTINMDIFYFNSSSSKLFFDFFDLLEEHCLEHTIVINWLYDGENDAALEAGEDYKEDFENLNIKLVVK